MQLWILFRAGLFTPEIMDESGNVFPIQKRRSLKSSKKVAEMKRQMVAENG